MSQPALSADDAISVAQKVISDQLAALVAKDARTAYSLASPDIRSKFTDENRFIEMVKKNYGPLSSSSRYAFGRSKIMAEGDVVLQEVTISGRDGKDWTAVYEVRHQGDGSYKINGVRMLAKSTSQGI
jgi:hypothetical protein